MCFEETSVVWNILLMWINTTEVDYVCFFFVVGIWNSHLSQYCETFTSTSRAFRCWLQKMDFYGLYSFQFLCWCDKSQPTPSHLNFTAQVLWKQQTSHPGEEIPHDSCKGSGKSHICSAGNDLMMLSLKSHSNRTHLRCRRSADREMWRGDSVKRQGLLSRWHWRRRRLTNRKSVWPLNPHISMHLVSRVVKSTKANTLTRKPPSHIWLPYLFGVKCSSSSVFVCFNRRWKEKRDKAYMLAKSSLKGNS